MPKTPAYRKRSGYDQAIVTLSDSKTKKRRDFWLGPHGSAESREMYHRLIAAWESAGRQLPEPAEFMPGSAAGHAPARHIPDLREAGPDCLARRHGAEDALGERVLGRDPRPGRRRVRVLEGAVRVGDRGAVVLVGLVGRGGGGVGERHRAMLSRRPGAPAPRPRRPRQPRPASWIVVGAPWTAGIVPSRPAW